MYITYYKYSCTFVVIDAMGYDIILFTISSIMNSLLLTQFGIVFTSNYVQKIVDTSGNE